MAQELYTHIVSVKVYAFFFMTDQLNIIVSSLRIIVYVLHIIYINFVICNVVLFF